MAYFYIDALAEMRIARVIFSCAQLDLQIDCTPVYDESSDSDSNDGEEEEYGPKRWQVWYDNTEEFRIGNFTYDLTVITEESEDTVTTFIHNASLNILPSIPPKTTYHPYWDYPHNTKKEH